MSLAMAVTCKIDLKWAEWGTSFGMLLYYGLYWYHVFPNQLERNKLPKRQFMPFYCENIYMKWDSSDDRAGALWKFYKGFGVFPVK